MTAEPGHRVTGYVRSFLTLGPDARRLVLGTLAINAGIGVAGVLFNLYLIHTGHGLAFVGLLGAITTVTQAIVAPQVGRLLNSSIKASWVMAIGTALWAAGTGLATIAPVTPVLVLSAILMGTGFSAATIPAGPVMIALAPRRQRQHLFSAYFGANTVGAMAGSLIASAAPILGALLLGAHGHGSLASARVGLILGAILAASGIGLFWKMDESENVEEDEQRVVRPNDFDDVPSRRLVGDVVVMLIATTFIAVTLGATMPFFPLYFASLHVSTTTIGIIFALSGLVCTIAAMASPLIGRWGNAPGFNVTRAMTGPLLALFAVQPVLIVAVIAYIGRNALGTVSGTLENVFAMEVIPPRHRAAAAGWRAFVFNLGWSAGSLTTGIVATRWGYSLIFAVSGILTLIGTYIYHARFATRRPTAFDRVRRIVLGVLPGHALNDSIKREGASAPMQPIPAPTPATYAHASDATGVAHRSDT